MLYHLNKQEKYLEFKECPWSTDGGNKEYIENVRRETSWKIEKEVKG
jgi:hypothetical protein